MNHHALIALGEQYMINPPIYGCRAFAEGGKGSRGRTVRDLAFNSPQAKISFTTHIIRDSFVTKLKNKKANYSNPKMTKLILSFHF